MSYDFLSGYNFAKNSDVIFSETISNRGIAHTYINESFELDDGDILFCKIDHVNLLFDTIREEEFLNNKFQEFSNKNFNMEKLKINWWIQKIKND